MNYALVSKKSNRVHAIFTEELKDILQLMFPACEVIEVESFGNATNVTKSGSVHSLSCYKAGSLRNSDAYYMITRTSEEMDIEEAYKLITTPK